jgi:hypothetical protein
VPKIALGSSAPFPPDMAPGAVALTAGGWPWLAPVKGYAGREIRSTIRGTSGLPFGFDRFLLGFMGRALLSNVHGPD